METVEFQTALTHILVNPAVREKFRVDPDGVGRDFGLTDRQLATLKAADFRRVQKFAYMLAQKRLALVGEMVPATFELLRRRDALSLVATRFVHSFLPRQSDQYANRLIRDTMWMCDMLHEMARSGELVIPHLPDVARCERTQVELVFDSRTNSSAVTFKEARESRPAPDLSAWLAGRPRLGVHARVETFLADMAPVMQALMRGGELPAETSGSAFMLFSKAPGAHGVRTARITGLTFQLLLLCDGGRTTREILALLAGQPPGSEVSGPMADGCLKVLNQLYQQDIITLEPAAVSS